MSTAWGVVAVGWVGLQRGVWLRQGRQVAFCGAKIATLISTLRRNE